MLAKTIFVLYLFITVILFESLKQSECSSDEYDERKYSHLRGTSFTLPVERLERYMRSPCIVGTRWRVRRCRRRGKRTTKAQMVSFSLLIARIKPCSNSLQIVTVALIYSCFLICKREQHSLLWLKQMCIWLLRVSTRIYLDCMKHFVFLELLQTGSVVSILFFSLLNAKATQRRQEKFPRSPAGFVRRIFLNKKSVLGIERWLN